MNRVIFVAQTSIDWQEIIGLLELHAMASVIEQGNIGPLRRLGKLTDFLAKNVASGVLGFNDGEA